MSLVHVIIMSATNFRHVNFWSHQSLDVGRVILHRQNSVIRPAAVIARALSTTSYLLLYNLEYCIS